MAATSRPAPEAPAQPLAQDAGGEHGGRAARRAGPKAGRASPGADGGARQAASEEAGPRGEAAAASTAARLEACRRHVRELGEGFRSLRRDHLLRAECQREEEEGQLQRGEERPGTAAKGLQSSGPSVFSSRRLEEVRKRVAASHETRIAASLRDFEENKKFLDLSKQEQLKKCIWRRGVSARALKHYLDEELDQETACLSLIWAVIMLLFFCLGMFSHMRLQDAHSEDHAVVFDVEDNVNFAFSGSVPYENGRVGHKSFDDVNSIPDFWSWMNLGLVPRLLSTEGEWDTMEPRQNVAVMCNSYKEALADWDGYSDNALSHTTNTTGIHGNMNIDSGCPETETAQPSWPDGFLGPEGQQGHTYLYYHAVVGGIRMRQEFTPATECPDQSFYHRLFSGRCVPASEPNYMLEPQPVQALYPSGEHINPAMRVFLNTHTSQADLRAQLRKLEDHAWLSPQTAKVEIMFTSYSPHLNSLTLVYLNVFLNRAGHMHKIIEPITFFLSPYEFWQDYLFDALWFLMVLKLIREEIPEIYDSIKENNSFRMGIANYISVGNLIDWLNIAHSLIICMMWGLYVLEVWDMNAMLDQADVTVKGSWQTDEERNDFFNQAAHVGSRQHFVRRAAAAYPLVVVFKFLKVCSYSPRLALMTDTLSNASVDIVHFAVVFFVVFMIYTTSAVFLFGQEVLMFSSFPRAIDATFKIVMGDFDWEELQRSGRLEAFLWFVTFMVLVHLIMLNMLIAIIMDVYTEVKSSLPPDADTLWSQLHEVIGRKWDVHYRGTRVSLRKIRKHLGLGGGGECEDGAGTSRHDLDIVRFVAMVPEAEDGDEATTLDFAINFRLDSDSLEFEQLGGDLFLKWVGESGARCAVRLKEDSTEYDRAADAAKLEPCYEGYQVTQVTYEDDLKETDAQGMLDVIHRHMKTRQSLGITIKKIPQKIEDAHDIEGLTNVLKDVKLTTDQAKIVLEAALRHAEESLNDGGSISDTNNRIAKISRTLDEVKALSKENLILAQPHL